MMTEENASTLISHHLFIIAAPPASFCFFPSFDRSWRAKWNLGVCEEEAQCGCFFRPACAWVCVCLRPCRVGSFVHVGIWRNTHAYGRMHTFSPWHHDSPRSWQECCSERRGFVEERKETGGKEKEGKKERKRLGRGKVQCSRNLEQDGSGLDPSGQNRIGKRIMIKRRRHTNGRNDCFAVAWIQSWLCWNRWIRWCFWEQQVRMNLFSFFAVFWQYLLKRTNVQ